MPSGSTTVTPITRSRIVPNRWRSGPERSSSRHSASVGSPGGSSESRCPCARERRLQRATAGCRAVDDAGQVAGLVLEDAALRSALQGPPSRAGGRGTGPAPRRRAAASGRACPGSRARPDRTRARSALHHREVVLAEHQRHRARLVGADAVLAGDRAARVDARLEDPARELLGARGLALDAAVVEDERMQVAVAGVEDVADAQPVLARELVDAAQHLRAASCAARRRPARSSSGLTRPIAANAALRPRHTAARSAGSDGDAGSRPRRAPRQSASTRARSSSTCAGGPSSSTISTAPQPAG